MPKEPHITMEYGENLAILALGFLAGDPERLGRFLSLAGIAPGMIRAAASDPAFLAGVLDHVAADEPLLLAVAEHVGVKPEAVMRARAALGGQASEREVT